MKIHITKILSVLALTTLLLSQTACHVQVQSGSVGVKKVWGEIQDETLEPGFHWLWIGEDAEIISTKTGELTANCKAASKDLQVVTTTVTMGVTADGKISPEMVQRVGNESQMSKVVLVPAVQESVKAVTAKFTAEELVTKREEVKTQIEEALRRFTDKFLEDRGIPNAIQIYPVAITDFAFSDEFNNSIEAKVKAEQDALRAKNEKTRRITEAEASAEEVTLAAQAQATSQKAKAEALAFEIDQISVARSQAIEREGKFLQEYPEVIKLRTTEKWNGVLPKYNLGNTTPLISLPKEKEN